MELSHPATVLDEGVHQRVRLGVLAVAVEGKRVDFAFLRDTLDLTAGNLSRHLQVLEKAGYLEVDKVFGGRRPRTWVRVTAAGGAAFDEEMALLESLLPRVRPGEGAS